MCKILSQGTEGSLQKQLLLSDAPLTGSHPLQVSCVPMGWVEGMGCAPAADLELLNHGGDVLQQGGLWQMPSGKSPRPCWLIASFSRLLWLKLC